MTDSRDAGPPSNWQDKPAPQAQGAPDNEWRPAAQQSPLEPGGSRGTYPQEGPPQGAPQSPPQRGGYQQSSPQPGGFPPGQYPSGQPAQYGSGPAGAASQAPSNAEPRVGDQPGHDVDRSPGPIEPPPGFDDRGRVRRTKVSGVWIGLVAAVVVLILLIIFIAQNLDEATVHFLRFSGRVSLGLAMLVAALCGVVIAVVPGSVRIFQLRKALRANADTDALRHKGKKR